MPNQDAHRLAHLFPEIVNTRQLDRFADLVSPGYVNHNPHVEQGLNGVRKFFEHFVSAVPDLKMDTEFVLAAEEGRFAVGRYTYSGTHKGVFMGAPPTGNALSMRSIDVWRVENGRFVEHWDELNSLDLFLQIGAARMAA